MEKIYSEDYPTWSSIGMDSSYSKVVWFMDKNGIPRYEIVF